jgi:hypothetical protein
MQETNKHRSQQDLAYSVCVARSDISKYGFCWCQLTEMYLHEIQRGHYPTLDRNLFCWYFILFELTVTDSNLISSLHKQMEIKVTAEICRTLR